MMGQHQTQEALFSFQVNLDKRIPADHVLRKIYERIDFSFVRSAVADTYGRNGNESIDPQIVLKLMFLLFLDNIASERELMRTLPYRLDYLWFLGYGLDDTVPNHSVLSKARKRWGVDRFREFFVRVVAQCVEAGLVAGEKIHMDGSLVRADASKNSVVTGPPELIEALRKVYAVEDRKLEDSNFTKPPDNEAVNDRVLSTTDPDSSVVRKGGESAPRYKNHRVVDDAHGVITAVKTTSGDVSENSQFMGLVEEHEATVGIAVKVVVADRQYGTVENFQACQDRGIRSHMGDMQAAQKNTGRREGIYGEGDFVYDAASDTYRCPAGETLSRRKHKKQRAAYEYATSPSVCAVCLLRAQCTRAQGGARTIKRHMRQEVIDAARAQSRSAAARRDRVRRKWRMEGSFADAANNHGFKRARWRRLWRQQIQDYMIAAVQNVRILLARGVPSKSGVISARNLAISSFFSSFGEHLCFPTPYCVVFDDSGRQILIASLN